jgi:hypothetical protein
MVAAAAVLCRIPRPGWAAAAVAGGLFAAAALTRTVGLAMLPLPFLYLLTRRPGWRAVASFLMVVAGCLGGYLAWYQRELGTYSFGTYSGRFLWSRTVTFVDCGRIALTDEERRLCPPEPAGHRESPDVYLWRDGSPNLTMWETRYDPVFASFARKAILAQPVDYGRTVLVDTLIFLRPDGGRVQRSGHTLTRTECLTALWDIPAPHSTPRCHGDMAYGALSRSFRGPPVTRRVGALSPYLSAYSRYADVPATLAGLALLLVLVLMLGPRRRLRLHDAGEPLLWAGLALGMIIVAVATSALDPRYATPSIPLATAGAALGWQRFRARPAGTCSAPR